MKKIRISFILLAVMITFAGGMLIVGCDKNNEVTKVFAFIFTRLLDSCSFLLKTQPPDNQHIKFLQITLN